MLDLELSLQLIIKYCQSKRFSSVSTIATALAEAFSQYEFLAC